MSRKSDTIEELIKYMKPVSIPIRVNIINECFMTASEN